MSLSSIGFLGGTYLCATYSSATADRTSAPQDDSRLDHEGAGLGRLTYLRVTGTQEKIVHELRSRS